MYNKRNPKVQQYETELLMFSNGAKRNVRTEVIL